MRTPGRCTNVEGCWISASHRDVWLSVGQDFVCPNCGGLLSAPLAQTRSFRAFKRVVAVGALATMGVAAVALGAVKLSTVSFSARTVVATVADSSTPQHESGANQTAASTQPGVEDRFQAPAPKMSPDRMALDVIRQRPSSEIGLVGISTFNPSAPPSITKPRSKTASSNAPGALLPNVAPTKGPLLIYVSSDKARGSGPDALQSDVESDGQGSGTTEPNVMQTPSVTHLGSSTMAARASTEAPVVLNVTFGQPNAPETDREPVSERWHHRAIVTSHNVFLPAPAQAAARASGTDAMARICAIPSLL